MNSLKKKKMTASGEREKKYYIESQKWRKKFIWSVKVKIKSHIIKYIILFIIPLLQGVIVLIEILNIVIKNHFNTCIRVLDPRRKNRLAGLREITALALILALGNR